MTHPIRAGVFVMGWLLFLAGGYMFWHLPEIPPFIIHMSLIAGGFAVVFSVIIPYEESDRGKHAK